jgi:hypothetical protein
MLQRYFPAFKLALCSVSVSNDWKGNKVNCFQENALSQKASIHPAKQNNSWKLLGRLND